jgi:hypothetical protein
MNMPAAMMSKRPALRPGMSEPNSVSTPSTCAMPIFASTALATSGASPVSLPSGVA